MIGPDDLLHLSPAPHFKTFQVFLIYKNMRMWEKNVETTFKNVVC
jgi:hypothetical protein